MTTPSPSNTHNTSTLPSLSSFDVTPIELSLHHCTTLINKIDTSTQLLQQWQAHQSQCNELLSLIAQIHVWYQQTVSASQPCLSVKLIDVQSVPSLHSNCMPHCSITVEIKNMQSKLVLPLPRDLCNITVTLSVPSSAGGSADTATPALTHHLQLIPTKQHLVPNEVLRLDVPLPNELVGQLHRTSSVTALNMDLLAQYCINLPHPSLEKKVSTDDATTSTTSPTYILHLPLGTIQLTAKDLKSMPLPDQSSIVGSKQWYQNLVQGLQNNNTPAIKA